MVEINAPPSRSVEDIAREYLAGAGLAVEAARTLDLRLYPLAAYPLAAECALRDVRKNLTGFVAQECMDFSTHVLGDGGPPESRSWICGRSCCRRSATSCPAASRGWRSPAPAS